jgi:AcrR family transcriptional regulator
MTQGQPGAPPAVGRMASSDRRAQLIEAARALTEAQGSLPVPLEALAREAGVSKALVYRHFASPHELYSAILDVELDRLEAAGLAATSQYEPLELAACALADVYFSHVVRRGPILHVIYRDLFMKGRLPMRARRVRDRRLGHAARRLRDAYGLGARNAVAATSLLLTIPEEAGRLVRQGRMAEDRARLLCRELILGGLESLRAGRGA